jgi:hypothetical protein
MENLREFDSMKEHMREIRKQYDGAINEKNAMIGKYRAAMK